MHVLAITEPDESTTFVHVRHRADLASAAERELRRADPATRLRVLRTLDTAPAALRDVPIGNGRTLTVTDGRTVDGIRTAGTVETRRHVFPGPTEQRAAVDAGDTGGTLDGYAVVWDYSYPISDRHGDYMESFRRGSFAETLRQRMPIAQYDHGAHPMVGSIPVATWDTATEDTRGLRLTGRIADSWLVLPVRSAIRDGRVNGMSIRFAVVRENWSKQRDRRTITAADLYEAGPVAMPASGATSIGLRQRPARRTNAQRQALALSTLVRR